MQVRRQERLTQAFVMTRSDVGSLHSTFEKHVGNVRLEAKCADQLERTFVSLDEFDRFDNPEQRAIRQLTFHARESEFRVTASLAFDNDETRNVFISIEGDESQAIPLNDALDGQISAMRPWYAMIARTDWTWILLGALAAFILGALVVGSIISVPSNQMSPADRQGQSRGTLFGIAIGIAPWLLGFALNRLRSRLFPMATFAIGHGEKRHKNAEILRTVVVIAFAVSLLASVAAAFLMRA